MYKKKKKKKKRMIIIFNSYLAAPSALDSVTLRIKSVYDNQQKSFWGTGVIKHKMLKQSFNILVDIIEKQKFISNTYVSWEWIYVKLWLKVWHKAINIKYYWVAHQLGKGRIELLLPSRDVQYRAIVLIGHPIKCRLGGGFYSPMITTQEHWSGISIGWPIGIIYSGVWTPIKEDPEKGADQRLVL